MIDYGLFALLVVILVLVFLAFHAWRGVRSEADRISTQWTRIDSRMAEIQTEAAKARADADEARRMVMEVQGTHYKTLLRRIDESEASTLGHTKQVEALAEKIASIGGRMSSLQRWAKDVKQVDTEPDPSNQIPMFPAAMPTPGNLPVTGHFGRMPGRKVG